MATEQSALRQQLTVVTSAGGAGVGQVGPSGAYETWQVERLTISSASGTIVALAVATLYRGGVGGQVLDGTFTPWFDFSETNIRFYPGEQLVLAVTGYPSQTINLLIEGTRSYQT